MKLRSTWISPFGLALLIGSAAALVAGYFTGSGLSSVQPLNLTAPVDVNALEPTVDENALIAANREPPPAAAAPAPAPAPVETAPVVEAGPETQAAAEPENASRSRAGSTVELAEPPPPPEPRRRRNAEPPPDEPGDEPHGN